MQCQALQPFHRPLGEQADTDVSLQREYESQYQTQGISGSYSWWFSHILHRFSHSSPGEFTAHFIPLCSYHVVFVMFSAQMFGEAIAIHVSYFTGSHLFHSVFLF